MMKELLFNLIRKHHYNISIYTEEIFERRCQEEIIRSDEEKSSFVYVEFDFNTINRMIPDQDSLMKFWVKLVCLIVRIITQGIYQAGKSSAWL